MTTATTRAQLLVFAVVTALAVTYGAIKYLHVDSLISPPFEVKVQFMTSGGIYERADVDLLGTRVGSVKRIDPGPGTGTTVVLALDRGAKIPRDVAATIADKSAIGEQYVELTPSSAGGPILADGDVIPLARTSTPVEISQILGNLNELASSIPTDDLATVMKELSVGLDGIGGALGDIIDDTNRLTRTSLANVDDINALIVNARTVLDTQVEERGTTTAYLRDLAGLTSKLRDIDNSFDEVFAYGIRAGTQVSNLLADNQSALPVLLNHLLSVTTVAADRIPALRKTLVVFPWAVELGATGIRRCDSYNPTTGKPIETTCRYDAQGKPIYNTYISLQLPGAPGIPPYFPCTEGYEQSVKYYANGTPVAEGPKQEADSPVNMNARCTAKPDDLTSPLVRGAQNVTGASSGAARTAPAYGDLAIYDPVSGVVASPDGAFQLDPADQEPPPTGTTGLAWLMTGPLR